MIEVEINMVVDFSLVMLIINCHYYYLLQLPRVILEALAKISARQQMSAETLIATQARTVSDSYTEQH